MASGACQLPDDALASTAAAAAAQEGKTTQELLRARLTPEVRVKALAAILEEGLWFNDTERWEGGEWRVNKPPRCVVRLVRVKPGGGGAVSACGLQLVALPCGRRRLKRQPTWMLLLLQINGVAPCCARTGAAAGGEISRRLALALLLLCLPAVTPPRRPPAPPVSWFLTLALFLPSTFGVRRRPGVPALPLEQQQRRPGPHPPLP